MSGSDALRDAVGEEAFERHEPREVDGVAVGATLRPADGEALAAALRALGELGLAALPRGGGTDLALGNLPRRADVFLSTERLAGVDVLEPGEGVCHAGAGTPLAALRAEASAVGWELPLEGPDDATVGGALAAAVIGPRTLGFGPPRDVVLGLEVALASGERTRCGGRVVKNVTGYDLAKLYTGSLGSLGVIEAAWLRLRPAPEAVRWLSLPARPAAEACRAGLVAARLPAVRACALLSGPDGLRGLLELAGDAESVEAAAAALPEADPADAAAHGELCARQRSARGLRWRIAALPEALPGSVERLLAAGASLVVHPGLRLVYADLPLEPSGDGAAAFALAEDVSRRGAGHFVCECAPPEVKRGRDVFGVDPGPAALMRALKSRFDPAGVLNPGRFAGGL